MGSTTVAHALVDQLAAAGVQRVYGVVGDAVFELADALHGRTDIAFVAAAHETGAAFMASYEAKLTGVPTACMATSGPGAANLAAGFADACLDGAPVVALTGQVPTGEFGMSAKQYFDQQMLYRGLGAPTELALAGEGAMHALLAGLCHAIRHRTATHISIPRDIFGQPVEWTPLPVRVWEEDAGADAPAPCVLGDWQSALARLGQARRPVVVLGTSAPRVVRETVALARTLGAGLVTAQQAKGAVPFSDPNLVGGIGEACVPRVIAETDVLILVGRAPYELRYIPPTVPALVVSREHVPISRHPLLAEAVGAPEAALRVLRRAVADRQADPAWLQAITQARQELAEAGDRPGVMDAPGRISPRQVARALSHVLDEDAVIALDIGAFAHWFDLGFAAQRQEILISTLWRGMGAALPAAIAARLSRRERQVVAVVGDGALLMSMAELTTAVREQLALTVVVIRNGVYDLEQQRMSGEGLQPEGTTLHPPDFVAFAAACGATGIRVDDAGALRTALQRALAEAWRLSRPVVVEVRTDAPTLPCLSAGNG